MAIPMIGGSILQSIQSMVDMFFVGKLGPQALAAVGMSGAALMILITVFMGINISTAAMVARAIGAQDEPRANHIGGQAIVLAFICSVFIGVAGYVGAPVILSALGAEETVVELGTGYLHLIFMGIFFLCAVFIMSGIFHGAGDATTPLMLGILTTACNCMLNPIMIFGYLGFPAMGVRGSALATIIARALAFVVGMVLLMRHRLRVQLHLRDFVPNLKTMWTISKIGIPSSLQMTIRTLMNLALMRIAAQFGTLVVAAYVVGLRIRMIGLFPLFGFAGSAATMVGQNLGAGRPRRSEKSAYTAMTLAFGAGLLAAAVFFIFARPMIAVFNDSPEVVATGARFLRITAFGLLASSVGIVLSRAMNGAGDTVSPLVITLISLWGFQIPAAVYLSGVKEVWGVVIPWRRIFSGIAMNSETGIWYAMVAAAVFQATLATAWFMVGRWKRIRV